MQGFCIVFEEGDCMAFLEVKDLTRIYGKKDNTLTALDHVSFSVEKGEFVAITGASGSGKSTMGRVLCGLLKPDSGEAVLDGVSVYASRAGRRNLQNKLSIVFQDYTTSANCRRQIRYNPTALLRNEQRQRNCNLGECCDQTEKCKTFL